MAMIPQIGMLFWAISFRLRDYGVTENRYFVLVFGAWLLVCAIYYLVSRAKDIRFIPMSLCLLVLLSSLGPWSTFAVSEWSQVGRLEKILVRNGVLQNGTYVSGRTNLPPDDEEEILEIMKYLELNHDFDKIEPWFGGEDLDAIKSDVWDKGEKIVQEKFGLDVDGLSSYREYFFLDLSSSVISLETEGYDQFASWSIQRSFLLDGGTSQFFLDGNEPILELRRGGEILARVDLNQLVELAYQKGPREGGSQEEMTIEVDNEQIRLRLIIQTLDGVKESGSVRIERVEGLLFATIK